MRLPDDAYEIDWASGQMDNGTEVNFTLWEDMYDRRYLTMKVSQVSYDWADSDGTVDTLAAINEAEKECEKFGAHLVVSYVDAMEMARDMCVEFDGFDENLWKGDDADEY